ncbi:MAG TPA: hypothetical protein VK541_04810 [Pedobacter sp.]|uniref:hypothetical protein n=1 Tax=Pedobacter sp. TaxID=1411316 RepID=UPI002B9314C6|nr:hypothetical protein [Pedobacter sp.]HMI01779.1 hypothetical protein [Pedobacter sp.]
MDEEILQKLDMVLKTQQELMSAQEELRTMMLAISDQPEMRAEVWLTKEMVMAKLFIEKRSFYRKRKRYNWIIKEIAGIKYYLESSLEIG